MKHNLVLIAALSMALGGCGGGGGGGTGSGGDGGSGGGSGGAQTPAAVTTTGQAVDGYLSGANAFYDANANGQLDAGEPSAVTDANGTFTLTTPGAQSITVVGGINVDTGLSNSATYKAPAGSKFVTPLTTLITSGGISAAQLQSNLGLLGDVTQTNPMTDPTLHARTLAVQQMVQQIADTLAALAGNGTQQARGQLYGLAATSVAQEIAKSQVTLTDRTAVTNMTNAAIQATFSAVAASNTIDSGLKSTLAGLNPASVAALTAPLIAVQTNTIAYPDVASDPAQVKTTQSIVVASGIAALLNPYLTLTATSTPDTFAQIVDKMQSGVPFDEIATFINSLLGTTFTGPNINSTYLLKNFLSIRSDQVVVNGSPYSLADFEAGNVAVASPLTNIQFHVDVSGNPLPLNTATPVSLGLEVSSSTDSRLLGMIIDKALITVTQASNGTSFVQTVSVPADAKLYVFGRNSKGVEANATLDNASPNVIDPNCNCFSWNPDNALQKVAATLGNNNPVFGELQNIRGAFNVKMNISNVRVGRLGKDSAGNVIWTLANPYTIVVNQAGSAQTLQSVFGYGVQGKLNIQ